MNLREIAERDLGQSLEDADKGFAIPATITNPAGTSAELKVQSGDIHLLLDTEDSRVNNRIAHIAIRISSLTAAALDIPRAVPDESANPWIFEFADISGNIRKFTVAESMPDKTLGLVTVILELITD